MKKKGFTLAELVGVIVLLGAIIVIIIPSISKSLKDSKQKVYNEQIEGIKQALILWTNDNKPKINETYYLTLSQLKQKGLVSLELKNPINDEYFANDMLLKVINVNDIITYEVSEEGTCKSNYIDIPKINLDNNVEYIEVNNPYNDSGVVIKDISGNILNDYTVNSNVDTTKIGSYYITYSVSDGQRCNKSVKTVIVRDTTGPTISFSGDIEISINQINTYDFLADVVVSDNSDPNPNIIVTNNLSALKGTYTIKYVATDIYGNSTTRLRKVTVK